MDKCMPRRNFLRPFTSTALAAMTSWGAIWEIHHNLREKYTPEQFFDAIITRILESVKIRSGFGEGFFGTWRVRANARQLTTTMLQHSGFQLTFWTCGCTLPV